MSLTKSIKLLLLIIVAIMILGSCLGASADISIRADGSGKIALEYRVSQMLESMGRLDGNERWPAIPVGKADFERSLARIPGLRLLSFSAKNARNARGGTDLVTRAAVEFKNTGALTAFLDSAGNNASLIQRDGKNILRLVLLEPSTGVIDGDLLSLLKEISAGYEICFRFTLPKNAALSLLPASVPAASITSEGKQVSFAIGLGDIAALEDGLAIEVVW